MKKSTRFLTIALSVVMALTSLLCFTACEEKFDTVEFVANELEGVEETEYVICVSKNIPDGQAILTEINKAIASNIDDLIKRYDPSVSRPNESIANELFMTINELRDEEGDDPIRFYTQYFKNFSYTDGYGENLVGIDSEILAVAAIALGRSLDTRQPLMEQAYEAVKNGEGDVLASGIALTDEVKANYLVSDVYATGKQQIVALNVRKLHELKDLKGLRIGVVSTKVGEKLVGDAIKNGVLKNSGAEMVVFATDTEAKNAIQNERIDCIVLDELPAKVIIQRIQAGR